MAGPTLLDVFQSAAGTINTMTGILDNETKKQAELDVLNWQAQFRVDSENFIRNLNYNSYESWNDDLTKFLDEQRSAAQRNAANPYTAKQIDQLITSYSSTMRNQVEAQAYNRMQEHNLLSMQDTANINRQTLSGQARIDANSLLYKTAFDNNVISETNYRSLMLAETQQAASDYYSDSISSAIDRAFSPAGQGGSWADIEAQIRADNTTFINLAGDQIDKDGIRDNALKNGEKLYYARIGQIQDDNSNTLSEEFLKLVRLTSAADRYTAARSALALMDREMGGQLLSGSDRLSYSKLFSGIVDGYLDDQARAAGSGGTGAGNVTKDTFKNYIEASPETYTDKLLSGEFEGLSYYDALSVAAETMKDAFLYDHSIMNRNIPVEWKDKTGPDQWEMDYSGRVKNAFYDYLKKNFSATGSFNQIYGDYKNLENLVKKGDPEDWDSAALNDLFDYTLDLIASTPAERMGDITDQLEKYVNTCVYTQARSKLFFDPETSSAVRKNGAWSDKEIAQFARAAAENDIVFTDFYGRERVAHGANTDAYAAAMRYAVANRLGLSDSSSLSWHYEPTQDDKNTTAIVTYGGREYKVEATANGKGYEVYDVTNGAHSLVQGNGSSSQADAERNYRNAAAISGAMAPQGDTPEELEKRRELISLKEIPPAVDTFSEWQKTYDNLNALDWNSYNNRDIIVQDMIDVLSTGEGKDIGNLYKEIGLSGNIAESREAFNKFTDDEKWNIVTSEDPAATINAYRNGTGGGRQSGTGTQRQSSGSPSGVITAIGRGSDWNTASEVMKIKYEKEALDTLKGGAGSYADKAIKAYQAAGYKYHTYQNESALSDAEYREAAALRFNALDLETQKRVIRGEITADAADQALYEKVAKDIENGVYGNDGWPNRAKRLKAAGYDWHRARDVLNKK